MRRLPKHWLLCLASAGLVTWGLCVSAVLGQKGDAKLPDLSEFRTVETAITSKISLAGPTLAAKLPAYLGLHVTMGAKGKLVVADVEIGSPAAHAGLKKGDVMEKAGNSQIKDSDALRELIQTKGPGEALTLAILRKNQPLELTAKLDATSRPASASGGQKAVMGISLDEGPKNIPGVLVSAVTVGMPADQAGIKKGDVIVKADGIPTPSVNVFHDVLLKKAPGDLVPLELKRDAKELSLKVKLVAQTGKGTFGQGSFDFRTLNYWKKDTYRLAVVAIEYPDTAHNKEITPKHWEESLFTKGSYNNTSVTGQKVFGSLNDYYLEQSFGKLRVEGKVFDYVQVSKDRMKYAVGSKSALFDEAISLVLKRDGAKALDEFDGIFFLYAGPRAKVEKGGIYWPHRSSFTYKGKRWPYFICPEGGPKMDSISVIAHEFGHMLGMPDLYDNAPGTINGEGLGVWCTMATGHGQTGKPMHFSAWCKEKLGWISPAVIDPTVKQKLILAPVEDSPKECFKVLIRPDGGEYLLLENRAKKGFDANLPGEGLLVWRVINNRPVLQESHGITSVNGPKVFLNMVPFPSKHNHSYTPYTTPSSQSPSGGGLPVWITNIHRLPDGRITFYVGYEYL